MRAAYCITISLRVSAALITATPCTTQNAAIDFLPSTPVTSAAMSTLAASDTGLDMTIAITNLYGAQLSLSFGLNAGFPSPLGDPQPTILPDSASTQYIYPTGWAGNILIGQTINVNNSLIEGSYTGPPDIDVSYVDGFSVPITCSSDGVPFTGCNIDLFNQLGVACDDEVDGPVCLNPSRNTPYGPAACFFAACAGAAYTFPKDDGGNRGNLPSLISCCIGTSCMAPSRQPGEAATALACSLSQF